MPDDAQQGVLDACLKIPRANARTTSYKKAFLQLKGLGTDFEITAQLSNAANFKGTK